MTDHDLATLLRDAADDDGRPLRFTAEELTRLGRVRHRRRLATVGLATAAAVAVVAGGGVAVAQRHASSGRDGSGLALDSPTSPTPVATRTTTRATTPGIAQDQSLERRCDAASDGSGPHLARDGWTLDARSHDAMGTIATFVSADGNQWTTCELSSAGDTLAPATQLPEGPVPASWRHDPTARDSGIGFGPGCPDAKDQPCDTRDYLLANPTHDDVARVEITSPDGHQPEVSLGQHTYTVRFIEPAPADGSSTPPVFVTLYDDRGEVIIRYDLNQVMR